MGKGVCESKETALPVYNFGQHTLNVSVICCLYTDVYCYIPSSNINNSLSNAPTAQAMPLNSFGDTPKQLLFYQTQLFSKKMIDKMHHND
jgi:hypothetical protein